eukprot:3083516-Pyramimonas_sp.AAC.1
MQWRHTTLATDPNLSLAETPWANMIVPALPGNIALAKRPPILSLGRLLRCEEMVHATCARAISKAWIACNTTTASLHMHRVCTTVLDSPSMIGSHYAA